MTMTWIEWLGVVFMLQIAALLILIAFPVEMLDEGQAELDQLIKEADEAVKNRPRVRAISTFQGEK